MNFSVSGGTAVSEFGFQLTEHGSLHAVLGPIQFGSICHSLRLLGPLVSHCVPLFRRIPNTSASGPAFDAVFAYPAES
jgi:hypothetical protein